MSGVESFLASFLHHQHHHQQGRAALLQPVNRLALRVFEMTPPATLAITAGEGPTLRRRRSWEDGFRSWLEGRAYGGTDTMVGGAQGHNNNHKAGRQASKLQAVVVMCCCCLVVVVVLRAGRRW